MHEIMDSSSNGESGEGDYNIERLFAIQLPEGLSQDEIAELMAELQRIKGITAFEEESRGVPGLESIGQLLADPGTYVVVAVSAGVVAQSLSAVASPIRYLRENAAKLKQIREDIAAIIETWRGKGDTEAKAKATFQPENSDEAKALKDVTGDDVEHAITRDKTRAKA
jgi:hypothetical protein